MDSKAIGSYVLPSMKKLAQRIPQLEAALLCTADGFNVCSLGVSQTQIGKLVALSSSLLSIGEATMGNLVQPPETTETGTTATMRVLDTLVLEAGDICLVGIQLKTPMPLNLLAAAKKTALGVVLMTVRSTALEITQKLPKSA